ncbi:MAG: hypothetical protein J6X02_01160, partial [Bacilli bacterium]|nr:hypothetical protein [Bacilli bacterium]
FVPKNDCRESYKSLLDLRNSSAQTYNSLADGNEKIKTKLGPLPWYLKLAIFVLIIIILLVIAQLV